MTVLTLWTNEQEREEVEGLKQYCDSVQAVYLPAWRSWLNSLQALPGSTPLQATYGWQPELVSRLARAEFEADVIHVEHLRGAPYGLYLKSQLAKAGRKTPIIWDSVDCISLLFRLASGRSKKLFSRWITRFELGRTEQYEGWLTGQFDEVLVTSLADKEALLSLLPSETELPSISILPNGVDLDYFAPDPDTTREPATLVISGKMSYHANITMLMYFVHEILPLIHGRRPDVKLCVAGKDPPREVWGLAQNPSIFVTGSVADIRPYLRRATMAVVPLTYGVGIQNKVLEAMACATPVVATPQAVSALNVLPGRDVLVAREPEAFAETVLDLLEAPQRQRQIGEAGRRYVEAHHPWTAIAAQLEEVYNEVISVRH
jgi:glycosyltransferase involved in cell wall biosynthesis